MEKFPRFKETKPEKWPIDPDEYRIYINSVNKYLAFFDNYFRQGKKLPEGVDQEYFKEKIKELKRISKLSRSELGNLELPHALPLIAEIEAAYKMCVGN
ncbi:MAG: hypothetical protein FJZ04_02190 [Candidatus Moranbacteria bacterium]|nr:hypothetical protein [Candidatus Moranbacteria bacterium]